jgi:transposase
MRDLVRARHSAMEGVRRARQQLLSFLLRHGRIYPTKRHWTRAHRRWLAEQRFEHPAQQIVFEELIQAVEQVMARRDRLEQQMIALVPNWSLQPVVAALQALRGVAIVAAIILAAEIGDFRRFANPRQLMAWQLGAARAFLLHHPKGHDLAPNRDALRTSHDARIPA